MRIHLLLPLLLLATVTCACPPAADKPGAPSSPAPAPAPAPDPGGGGGGGGGDGRTAAVESGHAQYARVEGTSFQNACSSDSQCFTGGCSSEVCSAEEGVNSTCEAPADGWPTAGATCGCVQGQCIWYKGGGGGEPAPGGGGGAQPSPGGAGVQGQPCATGDKCNAGLTCLTYYGIAGERGPKFTSCEIRCGANGSCPAGQQCETIADGPGEVCRPK